MTKEEFDDMDDDEVFEYIEDLDYNDMKYKDLIMACRAWWNAKGRYNTQVAACRIGTLIGEEVTWPKKK